MRKCYLKGIPGLLILLGFLFTGLNSFAQLNPPMGSSPWSWNNPQPHGHSLLDMSFIDNNTGLAVGTNGGIVRTTDGGANWTALPFKFVNNANTISVASFNDVQFVTPTIAYAVGNSGLMIKTTDGGINWSPVTTPLTALGRNINALHFLNKDSGYIGGQAINTTNTTSINDAPKVYFTKNGGASWDSLATPFRPQQNAVTLSGFNTGEIHRIHFVNDSVGYVSGSCGSAIANYSAILWKIEKNVVKDYSIHRTKFGITATTGTYTPATQTFKGLVGINDSLVLISSLNNNVVIRVRTGKNDSTASAAPAVYGTYERGAYEIVIWLNSTATPFPANLAGNIAGQMQQLKKDASGKIYLTSGNSILFSTDKGTTWTFTKPMPATLSYQHWTFSSIDITPNGRILAGSFNGLVYDSIAGAAWKTPYKNIRPLFYSFTDLDWADCDNGMLVGANGVIFKTTDGGKTWSNNSNPVFDAALISLGNVFYHATNNMFFSAGNSIYKSADQGITNDVIFTEPVANASTFPTGYFTMAGPSRAFVVGYRFSPAVQRTVIFRSLNANAAAPTWDTVKTFPQGTFAPQFRNIKFANPDTGYTCGSRGKIYRTTDGGASWTDISFDTVANGTITYTALSVVNGKTLYVGGNSRKLLKSTDAGATWTDMTLSATTSPIVLSSFSSVSNIVMNDANSGYLQSGSAILKTTNGWTSWTADMSPTGVANITLYPKLPGTLDSKKLFVMSLVVGSSVNSVATASLLEFGNAATYNISSTETIVNASCGNPNGSVTINATGGFAPYTYSVDGGTFQTVNTITGLSQGNHTIRIKEAGCGRILTKTINIVNTTPPSTASAGPDKTIVQGGEVILEGSSSSQVKSVSWTPASLIIAGTTTLTPTAKPVSTTTYTINVVDMNNCPSTDNVVVTVLPYCLQPMNAFTPNGDGINDKWLATQGSACTTNISITIFNRYGNTVYKNDHYQNNWDGTYNGKPVADGTYYYAIVYTLLGGKTVSVKGDVTILR